MPRQKSAWHLGLLGNETIFFKVESLNRSGPARKMHVPTKWPPETYRCRLVPVELFESVRLGDGNDTILDFAITTVKRPGDQITLSGFGTDYTADVHDHMTQVGSNVVIDFNGADTLTINNTTTALLDANSAQFQLL
jgi:hypothetical protein